MNINIDRNSNVTLVNQISNAITNNIKMGNLLEGSRLPSIRAFAYRNDVSHVTVSKAYKKLEKSKFIELIHGKGAFVIKSPIVPEQTSNLINPFQWQSSIKSYGTHIKTVKLPDIDIKNNLAKAIINPGLLPSEYLVNEIKKILLNDPQIITSYGTVQGDFEVRKAVLRYIEETKKLKLTPSDVIITNGVQQGIDIVAKVLIDPGDIVITEGPTYPAAIDVFRSRGAQIISIPMDSDGLQTSKLKTLCLRFKPKLIYTIPTFQNPTGTVLSLNRRKELINLAIKYQFTILEDDSWNDIYYDESAPPPTIKSLDYHGHVIYLKGFSKYLAPSCRIGAIISHGLISQRLLEVKRWTDNGNSLLSQKAIIPFLVSNRMNNHLKKLRIALEIRRNRTQELLTKFAPKEVMWELPAGGLSIWLSLPINSDTDLLLKEVHSLGMTFLPGSDCFPDKYLNNFMRISFSLIEDCRLDQAIMNLCQAIYDHLAIK